MKSELDLAIIGGGIIGVFAAWYARKQHPDWHIGLFEQGLVGSGATFYSARLDIPYGHTPLRYQLAQRSRSLFAELRKEMPELPIKDLPFYGIVQEDNAQLVLLQLVDNNARLLPEIIPSLLHDHPLLVLPQHAAVISGATASQAVNNELVNLLAKNFEVTPNSLIIEHTKIVTVTTLEDIFDLQSAGGNYFPAKRVIQATGPWMNEILGTGLFASQKTRIKKIVAFHIDKQPLAGDPLFYFFADDAFLMPKYEAGYWLFSFKCDHWDVVPDINTLSIDEADIQKARGILTKYFPQLVPLCSVGRVFCDTYTPDGNPIIERAGDQSKYIIAGAGSGSGFRLAPAIAEAALDYYNQ
ncbi:MAG: FAD-binding oxidoreductase [Ferruginibacter sp.]|nr:FAD-binding oxidoreductase [Ferruginibacter sp.]